MTNTQIEYLKRLKDEVHNGFKFSEYHSRNGETCLLWDNNNVDGQENYVEVYLPRPAFDLFYVWDEWKMQGEHIKTIEEVIMYINNEKK